MLKSTLLQRSASLATGTVSSQVSCAISSAPIATPIKPPSISAAPLAGLNSVSPLELSRGSTHGKRGRASIDVLACATPLLSAIPNKSLDDQTVLPYSLGPFDFSEHAVDEFPVLTDARSLSAATRPGTTAQEPVIHVQLNKENFWEAVPALKQAIANSTFVALDCEMTGLWAKGTAPGRLDAYETRYKQLRESASQFMPVQLGLSCYAWAEGSWRVQTFCITMYPATSEGYNPVFSCRADCLQFLAQQGFDIASWITNGAKFMPLSVRTAQLAQLNHVAICAEAGNPQANLAFPNPTHTPHSSPASSPAINQQQNKYRRPGNQTDGSAGSETDSEAMAFAMLAIGTSSTDDTEALTPEHCSALRCQSWMQMRQRVLEWLDDQDIMQSQQPLHIPSSTRAAAAMLWALIRSELWCRPDLPSFQVKMQQVNADESIDNNNNTETIGNLISQTTQQDMQWEVVLERADECQRTRGVEARHASIHKAAGPALLLELIRDAGVPVVVHNGLLDLALIMTHLRGGPLPETWPEYKALLMRWFPGGIYDTKHIAGIVSKAKKDDITDGQAGSECPVTSQPDLQRYSLLELYRISCANHVGPAEPTSSRSPFKNASSRSPLHSIAVTSGPDGLSSDAQALSHASIRHDPGYERYQQAAYAALQPSNANRVKVTKTATSSGSDSDESSSSSSPVTSQQIEISDDSGSESSSSEDSKEQAPLSAAHEAGFDAFMTGAVFAQLSAQLAQFDNAVDQTATGATRPRHASKRPMSVLQHARPYAWRLHGTKGLPYYDLGAEDPPPDLSSAFVISGLPPQTPWFDINRRFQAAGLGPVRVYMLNTHQGIWGAEPLGGPPTNPTAKNPNANGTSPFKQTSNGSQGQDRQQQHNRGGRGRQQQQQKGSGSNLDSMALVEVFKHENAQRVMQATAQLCEKGWTLQPVKEFYQKQQKQKQQPK